MKKKRMMALLLAAAMAAVMMPCANAEYGKEQYYEAGEGTETVYTVQLAASSLAEDSCRLRDALLEKGLDGYVYHVNQKCCVMSGKFRDRKDAKQYSEAVNFKMDRTSAAVVTAELPEEAVKEFEENYEPFGEMFSDECRHYGYLDDRTFRRNAKNIAGLAVQVAEGPNREDAYELIQRLREEGYWSYLYDTGDDGVSRIICGVFGPMEDAERYKESILKNTEIEDAYIVDVNLPKYAVNDFNRLFYSRY